MTQSAVAAVMAFLPVVAVTAAGSSAAAVEDWAPEFTDDHIWLDVGEGLRLYQPDAGTTSDTRRFVLDFVVEEVTSEF